METITLLTKILGIVVAILAQTNTNTADIAALKANTPSAAPTVLAAAPGADFFSPATFYQTATIGGNVLATSSQGTVTYTAASLQNTELIQHTATAATTATLPASSTLSSFAPRPGNTREIFLAPITSMITLAAGTGTDLNTSSSTKVCLAGTICRLQFVRKSNSDFEVLLTSATGL